MYEQYFKIRDKCFVFDYEVREVADIGPLQLSESPLGQPLDIVYDDNSVFFTLRNNDAFHVYACGNGMYNFFNASLDVDQMLYFVNRHIHSQIPVMAVSDNVFKIWNDNVACEIRLEPDNYFTPLCDFYNSVYSILHLNKSQVDDTFSLSDGRGKSRDQMIYILKAMNNRNYLEGLSIKKGKSGGYYLTGDIELMYKRAHIDGRKGLVRIISNIFDRHESISGIFPELKTEDEAKALMNYIKKRIEIWNS